MKYEDYIREPFVPFAILDRLTAAGLGDVPQYKIGKEQFEAAMQMRPVARGRDRGNRRKITRRLAYLARKNADLVTLRERMKKRELP